MMNLLKLREEMKKQSIDQLLISDQNVIQYVTGNHYECGERMIVLLISMNGSYLFLNALFPSPPSIDGVVHRYYDHEDPIKLLSPYVKGTIGIDKSWPSHFLLRLMMLNPTNHYILSSILDTMMAIKTEEEQNWMREASRLNDVAMDMIAKQIVVGISEREVVNIVFDTYEKLHTTISFQPIVAIQENAADPHHESDERTLKYGDSIVIDIGCKYNDYCSDMTRTFFLGTAKHEEIYHIVKSANLAAIAAVRPGVTFADVDRAARNVIESAGYGEYFIHRTGHGIGRSVHEPFDVSSSNHQMLYPGMCFSIEPGIYIPGVIGIRIEDLVLVTKNGVEVLNSYPKQITIL